MLKAMMGNFYLISLTGLHNKKKHSECWDRWETPLNKVFKLWLTWRAFQYSLIAKGNGFEVFLACIEGVDDGGSINYNQKWHFMWHVVCSYGQNG